MDEELPAPSKFGLYATPVRIPCCRACNIGTMISSDMNVMVGCQLNASVT
jgi:hypothetical protein